MSDWIELNRDNWNERAPVHAASVDYAFEHFVNDPEYLSDVVRFDLPRLGDIHGLRGVHLQCHIGTDTLSLARLGARMTGLDFSPPALAEARRLAQRTGAEIDYVHSEVYSALEVLPAGGFDLVFTGIGALNWLPSVDRWAQVVSALLAPGGRLFIREGHPVLWSLDYERPDGAIAIEYHYFEQDEPVIWDEPGTYVETNQEIVNTRTAEWNHGLGEVVTALLDAGLRITMLVEHDSVPWRPFPGEVMDKVDGEHRLRDRPERVPLTYTIQAVKDP